MADRGALADDDPPDAFRRRPQDISANGFNCGSEDAGRLSSHTPEQDLFNDVGGGVQLNETTSDVPTLSSPSMASPNELLSRTEKNSSERSARSAALPSRPRPRKTESSFSNQSNSDTGDQGKNAFTAVCEYISFLFQGTKVYEQELERQEKSKKDALDKFRHGSLSRRSLTSTFAEEEEVFDDSEDDTFINDLNDDDDPAKNMDHSRSSTRIVSESLEALAVVEAMSNFREFKDVKQQLRHSFLCDDGDLVPKEQKVEDEAWTNTSTEQWKNRWKRFVLEKEKTKFDDVAIQNVSLPLSVDEFYHFVIADNATHSFGKFMRSIGEKGVDTTPWLPSHTTTSPGPTSRKIHYTHPITAPLAPPMAKALKKQSLHKFGNVGLCLETCTEVEDVPMADCFVVEDRLWVHASEDNSEECVVSVTFRIQFVKGSLFRRIIENATRKEYGIYWDQFANMIRLLKPPTALGGDELQKVAIELQHATELLLESEGQEIQMSSVLRSSIRTLSRRFSLATNVPTSRQLMHLEEKDESTEGAVSLANYNAGLPFVGICLLCFAMCYLNFVATRQIMTMNGLLNSIDARLEGMIKKLLESENLSLADKSCIIFR